MGISIDITDLSYDAKAREFIRTVETDGENVEQKCTVGIRPWPESLTETTIGDNGILLRANERCKKFVYCAEWWEGVTDKNDNPIKCTDENKKLIFDMKADPEFVAFVLLEQEKMKGAKESQEKNFSSGLAGTLETQKNDTLAESASA